MSRAQGLKAYLAALCLSAMAVDPASAQDASSPPLPEGNGVTSSETQDGSQPGWLLRGRGQNRIVNPFRATPAPGTPRAAQTPDSAGTLRLGRGAAQPGATPPTRQIPANAMATEKGWTCLTGFRRQGAECVAIEIPANATLDLTGRGWICERGFQRQGNGCAALVVPENASLVGRGNTWACNYGYRRQGQSCAAVVVPEHASLDKAGHAWACDAGYTQRGQVCIDNATALLQKQADQAVNARPGAAPAPAPGTGVTINSGETRQGRTSRARVVIGRF